MPITTLPTPPQRSDPVNFAARADAFFAALPTFVTEFNAMVPAAVAGSVTGSFVATGSISSSSNVSPQFDAAATTGNNATLRLGQTSVVNWDITNRATSGTLSFNVGGSDLVALQTNGVLLVGKSASGGSAVGLELAGASGQIMATRSGGDAAYLNRLASDGALVSLNRSNAEVGSISVTTTGTAYNTTSDYRLKSNPQPLTGSGAFIDALQPKTWQWVVGGATGVGFIAHEVAAVAPGSVVGQKDAVGGTGQPIYQAMEYGSAEFIANIVAELQSLRGRVAALEAA